MGLNKRLPNLYKQDYSITVKKGNTALLDAYHHSRPGHRCYEFDAYRWGLRNQLFLILYTCNKGVGSSSQKGVLCVQIMDVGTPVH